jgi:transposase
MKKNTIKYVGLDTHKNSIVIAIADEKRDGEVRNYGTIPNTLEAVDKFIRKQVSENITLRCVYEAGPTGFGLCRYLRGNGVDCIVVAPSMIPKKDGDRIKTDRRDARNLARLHRAGELQEIYIPRREDEAMRDLIRSRDDARHASRKAKQRLLSFLLRHGKTYSGKTNWTQAHFNWLAEIKMDHPAQQIAYQEYITSIHETTNRVCRLDKEISKLCKEWKQGPLVSAIQSLRGVAELTAVTIVAELGNLERFSNPKGLMAYLGLVPSEYSTGTTTRRGGITKTGNGFVRRVLVEASWTYRLPARMTKHLLKRNQGQPSAIQDIAWKAQLRLCNRFRRLRAKGKPTQVVTTAIARELIAFVWAISREFNTPERVSR